MSARQARCLRFMVLLVTVTGIISASVSAFAAEFVIAEPTGQVSETYGLNVPPPRPVNPPGVARGAGDAYGVVNTDNLFLRQGDSPLYAPVGILDGGTELILLGWNGRANDVWWYVQVGDMLGWAKAEFIVLRGDASDLPVVAVTGGAARPSFYIGSENWLYEAPNYGSTILCLVPGNLFYYVIGQDRSTPDFYEVEVTCDTGAQLTGWIPVINGILRNTSGVSIPVTW